MTKTAFVVLLSALCAFSGCVSEQSVLDKKVPGQREIDPKEAARTRLSLALNYMQRGDMTQAMFNLKQAEQLTPDSAEVANAFAYYYQQVAENDLAEASYRKAIKLDSKNADTYNNFGAFLCQIEKYADAEQLLLTAVKSPGYIRVAESYENLGLCAIKQQQLDKAHGFFSSALKHSPQNAAVLYELALVDYAQNNIDQAALWDKKIQALGQTSPSIVMLRFLVAVQRLDNDARQQAERLLTTVYADSREARIVKSGNWLDAGPEQMRQRYLAANPQARQGVSTTINPQIKVVKRKTATEQTSSKRTPTSHRVRAGETFYDIASQYQLAVSDLQRLNPEVTEADLAEGMVLKLQDAANIPASYQVQTGDTLFSIAYRFNLSVETLCRLNQLEPTAVLTAGQQLTLQELNTQ